VLKQHRLVKLTVTIASWCKDCDFPVTQDNIDKYLCMRGMVLSTVDVLRIYDVMLPDQNPYDIMPVTIHRRRHPQYWVPAASDPRFLVARVPFIGGRVKMRELYDSIPNALSPHLQEEYERTKKEKEALIERINNAEPIAKKPMGNKKKVILLSY
jgi:hypothetical protein